MLRSGVEDRDVQTPQTRDVVEHGPDLIVETQIRDPDRCLAALGRDLRRDALELVLLAGHQNRQVPRSCEPPGRRLAEPVADPGDERDGPIAHVAASRGARCGSAFDGAAETSSRRALWNSGIALHRSARASSRG